MKKIAAALALSLFAISSNASHIDIGLQGGVGNTWLFNNNISDQGANLDQVVSIAPLFGFHAQYAPSKFASAYLELNYAPVNQKYKGSETGITAKGVDRLNYFSIPVMLQLRSTSGFYFEIGPQVSFLTGANGDASTSPSIGGDYSDHDFKSNFKSTNIAGAFGLGGKWKVATNLYLNAGLRFTYGFSDVTNQYSETQLTAMETNGNTSITSEYAHQDQKGNFSYKPTHSATGHILVGLSYRVWRGKKAVSKSSHTTTSEG